MNRQAWLFVGGMAGLVVLGFITLAVAVRVFDLAPDDGAAASSGCRNVSSAKRSALAEGLEPGVTLTAASAVRSADYDRVYMIAGRLAGPGVDGQVGVWASNRLGSGGVIYAVDGTAREFSDWGAGPGLAVTDDGVREARACLD